MSNPSDSIGITAAVLWRQPDSTEHRLYTGDPLKLESLPRHGFPEVVVRPDSMVWAPRIQSAASSDPAPAMRHLSDSLTTGIRLDVPFRRLPRPQTDSLLP